MNKQIFIIKEKVNYLTLLGYLQQIATSKSKSLKRNVSWLQFAKKTKYCYRFLKNKERQWQILNELAQKAAQIYPDYTKGQIVDILANLVNITVKDIITLNKLKIINNIERYEKQYLNKLLIEIVNMPTYIPRYPWFISQSPIKNDSYHWLAKDLTIGEIVAVKKRKKEGFYFYEIGLKN